MAATFRNTVFEVNLSAIQHNYTFFKKQLNNNTKLMAVVKAFSYGHGAVKISQYLEQLGADYLAVAFIDEGIEIRKNNVQLPILVFNPNPEEFEAIILNQLEPTVYNLDFLQSFIFYLKEKGIQNYPVHIKLDTGMHRSGFQENKLDELLKLINTKEISIKSIFSHLAASEDLSENDFTKQQIHLFKIHADTIIKQLTYKPLLHILNSSGIINYPEAQFDMVRLGISLYGSSPLESIQTKLRVVGTLKSVITQIRTIDTGETVGYNRKFKALQKTTVATVPIGYADGINRHLGNGKGMVLINNKQYPIIGTICMDSLMVDITDSSIQIGDEVVFFGKNLSVNSVAKTLNTISYEVFTNVSKRVRRNYID